MRKTYWQLFIFYLFLAQGINGQNTYTFQKSTATYSPIVGGILVSGTGTWSPFASHAVPIGFTFNYFGNNYSVINCEGSGFCVFDPSFYYYTLHPYTVEMRDAGTGTSTSQSPITYTLTGLAPNRICKIQWQNCELKNNLGSYANFQLWLYETTNAIEARIGNCTINNPSLAFQNNGFDGPLISIYKTQGTTHYGYCVQGASPTESLLTLNTGTISNIFQNSMSAPPPSGKVYQFTPGTSSGIKEQITNKGLYLFPNPAHDVLKIKTEALVFWEIFNVLGTRIKKGEFISENSQINISDLDPGIYFIVTDNRPQKFIKE